MPVGGICTSIFSVFGSRRARPRRPALTSNQMMPFGSRVMPCVLAASPPGPFTLNILTAPVLVSMRPTVVLVGYVRREPEVSLEIGGGVMHERPAARGRAERPVAAVGGGILGRHIQLRRERH